LKLTLLPLSPTPTGEVLFLNEDEEEDELDFSLLVILFPLPFEELSCLFRMMNPYEKLPVLFLLYISSPDKSPLFSNVKCCLVGSHLHSSFVFIQLQ
jgi:hypothetical protein